MTEDFSAGLPPRRQIIEKEYANLNRNSAEVVLTTLEAPAASGGAGSGKTIWPDPPWPTSCSLAAGLPRELPPDADETMLAALENAAAGRTDVTDNIRRLCASILGAVAWCFAITFSNKAADELKTVWKPSSEDPGAMSGRSRSTARACAFCVAAPTVSVFRTASRSTIRRTASPL